ncbi:CaiB/BaiF CoA transferase family protein [Zavarzinia sp. CC-PAN008]|uniref:CaiB/BaiF CoA transferase family protein n=1 Tax=Zavarzinia sp. CC-PAN008 TaxID=3243332 RepID=UPI003F749851
MGQADSAGDSVFSGLKVVDCGTFIAGPASTTVLADFGADVIKLEATGIGDPYRNIHRLPLMPQHDENYCWYLDNRTKRGLSLDLKAPDSRAVVERLVQWADVWVTNYPPAVRQRLKVDWEHLSPLNERLIFGALSGYGETGEEASKPGYDATAYWARTGLMDGVRWANGAPALSLAGMGDHPTAIAMYGAVVTALFHRERTGKGMKVTSSLLANGLWSNSCMLQAQMMGASFYPRVPREETSNAMVSIYECADGRWFVLAGVVEARDFARLADAIGRPELKSDARFATPEARRENAPALLKIFEGVFRTRPWAEWRSVLDANGITFGVIAQFADIASDPQVVGNGMLRPLADAPEIKVVDSPIGIEGVSKVPPRRPPGQGEHNEEILAALGFSDSERSRLKASGALG